MAVLCYAQPLNNGICTANEYFWRLPFSATPIRILSVNKIIRNFGHIQFIAKSSSIYTNISFATSTRTFGKNGEKSPLKRLSRN